MNIQAYWDGNSGAVEYENRRNLFTTKLAIPMVDFDTLVYSEDDNVSLKSKGTTVTPLTTEEITAVKQFANTHATNVTGAMLDQYH